MNLNRTLRRALVFAAPVLLAGAVTQAQESTPILPGYWESSSRIALGPISDSDTERRCVRAHEIERFFSGPSNRHYTCTYPTREVANGRARFVGQCRDKRGRTVDVSVSGTYTPTTFQLSGNLRTSIGGVPIAPTGSIRARRISAECP
ncbi:DUF3617 family protein [Brevundimonas sp. 2R-24]|uniref:DUF3617 family protein n=1 Tax=Peiella sedimenti TaxID=3061083 RepID=A0ABT8SRC9_9CAUL|nr:DUF3617 family protein [Caulobacteraceae bacterium XZ-24]